MISSINGSCMDLPLPETFMTGTHSEMRKVAAGPGEIPNGGIKVGV